MDTRLKHRLVGTAVVVALAVIFLPELLRPAVERQPVVEDLNLPPRPVATLEQESGKLDIAVPEPESAPAPVVPDPASPRIEPSAEQEATPLELPPSVELEPEPEPPSTTTTAAAGTGDGLPELSPNLRAWVVQVGSFAEERNAEALRNKLREAEFTAFVEPARVGDRQMYRVRVGPELEKRVAERLKLEIQERLQIAGQLRRYP